MQQFTVHRMQQLTAWAPPRGAGRLGDASIVVQNSGGDDPLNIATFIKKLFLNL